MGTRDHTPAPLGAGNAQLGNEMVSLSGWRKGGHDVVSISHFWLIASSFLLTPDGRSLAAVCAPFFARILWISANSQWTWLVGKILSPAGTAGVREATNHLTPQRARGLGGVSQETGVSDGLIA